VEILDKIYYFKNVLLEKALAECKAVISRLCNLCSDTTDKR
jgi:hypothetical protein